MLCCEKNLLSLTTVGRCSFKSFTVSPTENIKYRNLNLDLHSWQVRILQWGLGWWLTDDFSQKYYFATNYRIERSYYLSSYDSSEMKSLWLTVFNGHLIESPGLLPKPNMCILTNLIMVLTFLCLLFVNFNPCSECWWQKGSFAGGCFVRGGH